MGNESTKAAPQQSGGSLLEEGLDLLREGTGMITGIFSGHYSLRWPVERKTEQELAHERREQARQIYEKLRQEQAAIHRQMEELRREFGF